MTASRRSLSGPVKYPKLAHMQITPSKRPSTRSSPRASSCRTSSPAARAATALIEHHGDAMLRLAGIENIVSWKPLPAELVQPGQLPDGILDVVLAGKPGPAPFVIEIASYPERRLEEQLTRDALL